MDATSIPPRGLPLRERPVWTDRLEVALFLLAVALDGALATYLRLHYADLPDLIAIHFNAYGEADLIGGRGEIYKLPLIGAVVWGTNATLATLTSPHDRVLGRVLLGTAVAVQVLLAVATWRIVS